MNNQNSSFNQYIEALLGVFTVDKGELKILLMRKKKEPYKGYWVLPGSMLSTSITLEDCVDSIASDKLGLPSLFIEQCHTFSNLDRSSDDRILATTYIGLIDNVTLNLKRNQIPDTETAWFSIDQIPKLGYDHDKLISKLIEYLKDKITSSNILKILFPSDFTLPELQKVYEKVLNKELDRRNFRKKFITMDIIEDTGYKNEGENGRPAKLYRFKEEMIDKDIF